MDEFEVIARYFKRSSGSPHVLVDNGDDCAVVRVPEGFDLAFSMDTVVAGVHFFADAPANLVAERAIRVALSDLAAMGATPLVCTLSLSLPHVDETWLSLFSQGVEAVTTAFSCPLVGGDTVCGALVITVHVQGLVAKNTAVKRSGAQVGDLVCVTGCLGDGAAALAVLKGECSASAATFDYLHERYYRPLPRFDIAQHLYPLASAAIDISDGLLADLGHICQTSGVGAEVDLHCLPLASKVRDLAPAAQVQAWALSGGDDYQLCFTVPRRRATALQRLIDEHRWDIAVVGEIVARPGIINKVTGADLVVHSPGYRHF